MHQQKNNKILIILGMHRSGTSLTAQWVQECGLNIGDHLMTANFSNRDGHFEDMDFHDLHEEILKNNNIPYGGFENLKTLSVSDKEILKIKELINKKSKLNEQWGWKDPRTCLLIDHYIKLLPKAKILIVIRKHNEVINSLIKRETISIYKQIKNSGRLGRLRLLKYKLTEAKKRKELIKKYTQATIIYYKKLADLFKNKQKKDILIINFNNIHNEEEILFQKLNEWNFKFKKVPLREIFNNDYITSNTSKNYINEKDKLKLNQLENFILNQK